MSKEFEQRQALQCYANLIVNFLTIEQQGLLLKILTKKSQQHKQSNWKQIF